MGGVLLLMVAGSLPQFRGLTTVAMGVFFPVLAFTVVLEVVFATVRRGGPRS
jgi:hypothetical protein